MPSAPIWLGVGLLARGQERHGGLEILDPVCRVFQTARFAFALALVGGIEGESDEPLPGQALRVQAGGLLLHAAARVTDHARPS